MDVRSHRHSSYSLHPDNINSGWAPKKNQFPWRKLPEILVKEGIVLENYPHMVQLPGGKPMKTNSKGINDLTKQEVKDLHEAIESKTFPLRFRLLPMEERGMS